MAKDKVQQRRFSLEDSFMKNSKVNDYLYGKLQSISQYDAKNNVRYVALGEYRTLKQEIADKTINKSGKKVQVRTIENHLNTLVNCSFVIKEKDRLILPYDEKDLYKLISLDMLNYILDAYNNDVLKVYLYLLNKSNKPNYNFTKKELMASIGYSTSNNARDYERIGNILFAIKDKIIFYEEGKDSRGLPLMTLKKVLVNAPTKK